MRRVLSPLLLTLTLAITLVVVAPVVSAQGLPAAGQKAPAVSLPSQDGTTVSLERSRGKWVVLYFYPKDQTPGCTIEAHNFQRDAGKYERAGAVVLGVSVDSVDSHREFCTKESLGFRLLSDDGGKVAKAYGSLTKMGDREVAARNTFLVDPEGVVRKVYLKVNPSTHSDDVLADLALLRAAK